MNILKFNESQFINFSYMVSTFPLLLSSSWRYSTMFSSRSYVVLHLNFVSMIHLIVIFYILWRKGNWMGENTSFLKLVFSPSLQIMLTILSTASIYFSFFSTIISCPSCANTRNTAVSKTDKHILPTYISPVSVLGHIIFLFFLLGCLQFFFLFVWVLFIYF